jgi:O-antigen/teichoic acid export membrane protein
LNRRIWCSARSWWQAVQSGRFAKNTTYLLASQAFGALTTLAFVPLLARYLGLSDYGRYAYVYAFVGLFENLAVFGLHQIFIREVAKEQDRASRYLGNVLRLKTILALGTFVLIQLAAFIWVEPELRILVTICSTEVILRKFFMINLALSRAFERMEYEFWVVVLERSTALVGVLAAIKFDWGLRGVFLAFLAAALVHASMGTLLVWKRLTPPHFRPIDGFWRRFLAEAWPIGLSLEGSVLYKRIGPVLLGQWSGPAAVGAYSGAYRIYEITNTVLAESVSRSALPRFSRLNRSPEKLRRFLLQVFLVEALVGVLIGACFWLLAPVVVPLLFGPEFEASIPILTCLAFAVPFVFTNALMGAALQAVDRQKTDGFLTLGGLAVNLLLIWILVPRLGALGAAWALVVAEILSWVARGLAWQVGQPSRAKRGSLASYD